MEARTLLILDTFTDKDFKKFFQFLDYEKVNKNGNTYKLLKFFEAERIDNYQSPDKKNNGEKETNSATKDKKVKRVNYKNFKSDFTSSYIITNSKIKANSILTAYSDSYLLLEKFLAFDRFKNYGHLYDTTLIEELHERGLKTIANKKIDEIHIKLKDFKNYHYSDFHTWFVTENLNFENKFFRKIDNKIAQLNEKQEYISKGNNLSLLYYYSICSATVECLYINYKDSKKLKRYERDRLLRIYKFLKKEVHKILPSLEINEYHKDIIHLYDLNIDLILSLDDTENFIKIFEQYKKILYKVMPYLHVDEKYNAFTIYEFLFPVLKRKKEYNEMELEFYKVYFNEYAYKNSGYQYITYRTLWYFIMRGDALDKKWTDEMLKIHLKNLEPGLNNRTIIQIMREATNFFKKGNFEKSIEILDKLHNEFKNGEIDIRIIRDRFFLLTMNYYDLFSRDRNAIDYQFMESNLNSLKLLVENKKRPELYSKEFLSFVKLFKELLKFLEKSNSKEFSKIDLQFLKNKIYNHPDVPAKFWLKNRIDDLISLNKKRNTNV